MVSSPTPAVQVVEVAAVWHGDVCQSLLSASASDKCRLGGTEWHLVDKERVVMEE